MSEVEHLLGVGNEVGESPTGLIYAGLQAEGLTLSQFMGLQTFLASKYGINDASI